MRTCSPNTPQAGTRSTTCCAPTPPNKPTATRATTLASYLETGYYSAEALILNQQALQAARDSGDRAGQANALQDLGMAHLQAGRYSEAMHHYGQALAVHRALGDRIGEATNLSQLSVIHAVRGNHRAALAGYAEACTLTDIGRIHRRRGRFAEAFDHHQRALMTFRDINDRMGEAETLIDLGHALEQVGRPRDALRHHRRAYKLAAQLEDGRIQAGALDGFASALHAIGRLDAAKSYWREALRIYIALRMPEAEAVRSRLHAGDGRQR